MPRRLVELSPFWISPRPWREGLGMGWNCVQHQNCSVFIWFRHPTDGKPPVDDGEDGANLYTLSASTTGFENATILERIDERCWSGLLVGGLLLEH